MALTIRCHEHTVNGPERSPGRRRDEKAEACRSLDTFCRAGAGDAARFGAAALLFTDCRPTSFFAEVSLREHLGFEVRGHPESLNFFQSVRPRGTRTCRSSGVRLSFRTVTDHCPYKMAG